MSFMCLISWTRPRGSKNSTPPTPAVQMRALRKADRHLLEDGSFARNEDNNQGRVQISNVKGNNHP